MSREVTAASGRWRAGRPSRDHERLGVLAVHDDLMPACGRGPAPRDRDSAPASCRRARPQAACRHCRKRRSANPTRRSTQPRPEALCPQTPARRHRLRVSRRRSGLRSLSCGRPPPRRRSSRTSRCPRYIGMAMAQRTPIMIITTSASIRLKPAFSLDPRRASVTVPVLPVTCSLRRAQQRADPARPLASSPPATPVPSCALACP